MSIYTYKYIFIQYTVYLYALSMYLTDQVQPCHDLIFLPWCFCPGCWCQWFLFVQGAGSLYARKLGSKQRDSSVLKASELSRVRQNPVICSIWVPQNACVRFEMIRVIWLEVCWSELPRDKSIGLQPNLPAIQSHELRDQSLVHRESWWILIQIVQLEAVCPSISSS